MPSNYFENSVHLNEKKKKKGKKKKTNPNSIAVFVKYIKLIFRHVSRG